jgi:hypothetical protein
MHFINLLKGQKEPNLTKNAIEGIMGKALLSRRFIDVTKI